MTQSVRVLRSFLFLVAVASVLRGGWSVYADDTPPDVLLIVIDDLNDWNSLLNPDAPIETPHLCRLAELGTTFTRAYCMSPACNPSRAATLTGLRPTTTGVYGNRSDWRRAMPDRPTLMQRFMTAGYHVRGAGKIFHHHMDGAFHDEASFDDFQPMRPQQYPPEKLNRDAGYGSRNTDWGPWPPRVEDSIDFHTVSYCIDALQRVAVDRPLFLACGIFKPHSPFFAPREFHQAYRAMGLPSRREDDWNDLPAGAHTLLRSKRWFWRGMMRLEHAHNGAYQDFVRSYAACASFADDQVGRLLDALEKSPRRERTIVVLWSDHGFHLGEKDHIEKFALWEKSNRVPLIVVAPGIAEPGTRCDHPVDLSTLYPSLLELCQLPRTNPCDGTSIVPLLRNPHQSWSIPALMTYGRGNHAVRSHCYRYIRYADGSEELYDHRVDPHEWANVVSLPGNAEVVSQHRRWLPLQEAPAVPDIVAKTH